MVKPKAASVLSYPTEVITSSRDCRCELHTLVITIAILVIVTVAIAIIFAIFRIIIVIAAIS